MLYGDACDRIIVQSGVMLFRSTLLSGVDAVGSLSPGTATTTKSEQLLLISSYSCDSELSESRYYARIADVSCIRFFGKPWLELKIV